MACKTKRAEIPAPTRDQLFAFSGGSCAKCRGPLFPDGSNRVTIADQAHVVAASKDGPRGTAVDLSIEERAEYENLVLLCPNCHRLVDKHPEDYPVSLLLHWKQNAENAVRTTMREKEIKTRSDLNGELKNCLAANHAAWRRYGPDAAEAAGDVAGEGAEIWDRKVKRVILPNSLTMLYLLDRHGSLIKQAERECVEEFRHHVDDLAARHLDGVVESRGARFPQKFAELVSELES